MTALPLVALIINDRMGRSVPRTASAPSFVRYAAPYIRAHEKLYTRSSKVIPPVIIAFSGLPPITSSTVGTRQL